MADLMCPLLTSVQVVPRGLRGTIKVQMVPVGMARAQSQQSLLSGGLGKGNFDPGREVMVYEASGTLDAGFSIKTPVGTLPTDPDPKLVADTLVVPCQGAACMFWGEAQKDCRLVSGPGSGFMLPPAATWASAKVQLNNDTATGQKEGVS